MPTVPWYRKRNYAHFDVPLSEADAVNYVSSPDKIARHSFFPFLAYDLTRRRYKAKSTRGVVSTKTRPIRVAAHCDGYIFAYYAWLLAQVYERSVRSTSIDPCVLAYRKGKGSNIDFAHAAFSEVSRRENCIAIAMDLESFFDSIDHTMLKEQWCRALGVPRLPNDHYAVFKAMTRYAWVGRDSCYTALGVPTNSDHPPRPLCNSLTFRNVIRGGGLVEVRTEGYGIPQGSPMSAVLSNVYMLPFDEEMSGLASAIGGYYRRYCDDILWIVPPGRRNEVEARTAVALARQGAQVRLNPAKTVVSVFVDGGLFSSPILQYLGFTYDGKVRRIRSQTLSKFWRRVVYGVGAAKKRAAKAGLDGDDGRLFKRKLYRRFTHLGKRNFFTYARRAWRGDGGTGIRAQMKRHWNRVREEIDRPLK